jgi:6-pyruvoyl-tetrahydropterin synthase
MASRYALHDERATVELEMRFEFDAEHALKLPAGGEEDRHFHRYLLIVRVTRPLDQLGFTIENRALELVVHEHVIGELKGAWLHTIIEQPTMERLAVWVWERLVEYLPGLSSVSVSEQKEHGATATYRGPQRA